MLKNIFFYLPKTIQHELRRLRYGMQIRLKSFKTTEIEYSLLDKWIKPGDWVLDIGANVGHYSLRLSELVGKSGRILVFEPVPSTVDLLASNMSRATYQNLSIFNVAVSNKTELVGMVVPENSPESKNSNYYRAHISNNSNALSILSISIDSLNITHSIKFVKIDVEGHEIYVLKGMENLIKRDLPVLLVEGDSSEVNNYLASLGYVGNRMQGSVNQVFEPVSS
jgi:FkbM family methyltransferase